MKVSSVQVLPFDGARGDVAMSAKTFIDGIKSKLALGG